MNATLWRRNTQKIFLKQVEIHLFCISFTFQGETVRESARTSTITCDPHQLCIVSKTSAPVYDTLETETTIMTQNYGLLYRSALRLTRKWQVQNYGSWDSWTTFEIHWQSLRIIDPPLSRLSTAPLILSKIDGGSVFTDSEIWNCISESLEGYAALLFKRSDHWAHKENFAGIQRSFTYQFKKLKSRLRVTFQPLLKLRKESSRSSWPAGIT